VESVTAEVTASATAYAALVEMTNDPMTTT
jgi:hypothetical protein